MDIIAGIIELTALWLIGGKNRVAFILFIGANIIWVNVALTKHIYGLLIVVIPAIFINCRNWLKWGKHD